MNAWSRYIDRQYRKPRGLIGWWIGRQMMKQHRPENIWTIEMLRLQPSDHVLEIGFGPGLAIREAARLVEHGKVSGVDFSPSMVQMAKLLNRMAVQEGRVDVRCGDVHSLPYMDGLFDKVYTIHSIYFWQSPDAGLREIYRVLKSGGMVALTILPKERFKIDNPDALNTPIFRAFGGDELCQMLSEVGFVETWIEDDIAGICPSNYVVMGHKS